MAIACIPLLNKSCERLFFQVPRLLGFTSHRLALAAAVIKTPAVGENNAIAVMPTDVPTSNVMPDSCES